MKNLVRLAATAAAILLAGTASAQAPGQGVAALFDSADRGDIAPIAAALAATTDADARALLSARLAAARFDPQAGLDPALARLAQGADPAMRRAALTILTSVAFTQGDYAEAVRTGLLLEQALADDSEARAGVERARRLAQLLVGQGRQSVDGPVAHGSVPARRDRVGLPRIDVTINGQTQEAVVDTGANLSVLSLETAQRLGVRVLDARTDVSNGVEGTVPVRIGVADRLEIAGTVQRNVAFLIIDDAQLTFPQVPGGYDIRAIVGLPALRALGRLRIENAGTFSVLPASAAAEAGASNLHGSGNDLFVDVILDGRPVTLHFDTGANQTSLSARYAAANPDAVAALQTGQSRMSSAGGTRTSQTATWPNAPLQIAGRGLRLPVLPINLPAGGARPPFNGTLGSDVLRAFESYTIDFGAMRLELGAPLQTAAR
jgi:predicted aspartyl protease